MIIPKYIGNGAYCYSNSVSMMLKHAGEDISPSLIEVLSGVGVGAFWSNETKLIFFSNFATSPDKGINNALKQLGFQCKESVQDNAENPPLDALKKYLKHSLAVVGPIDVAYLKTKGVSEEPGGDHYVVVYKITDNEVWIHDPQKYPALAIPIGEFKQIWKAENIEYRNGYYHYWALPKRIKNFSPSEVYKNVIELCKKVYHDSRNHSDDESIDEQAIESCADFIKDGPRHLKDHLLKFCFPLGARRALDYGHFFNNHNKKLDKIKENQAIIFSRCQIAGMDNDWEKVSSLLKELAESEKEFKATLFSI